MQHSCILSIKIGFEKLICNISFHMLSNIKLSCLLTVLQMIKKLKKSKPTKKLIFVDCLGAVDNNNITGVEYISSDLYRAAKKENPNRLMENQEASARYYIGVIEQILIDFKTHDGKYDGTIIYLMGTKAEVMTARHFFNPVFYDIEELCKPKGYIGTSDKLKFIRQVEQNEKPLITLYSDQYYSKVFNNMRWIIGSMIKVKSVQRPIIQPEVPNVPLVFCKTVGLYAMGVGG